MKRSQVLQTYQRGNEFWSDISWLACLVYRSNSIETQVLQIVGDGEQHTVWRRVREISSIDCRRWGIWRHIRNTHLVNMNQKSLIFFFLHHWCSSSSSFCLSGLHSCQMSVASACTTEDSFNHINELLFVSEVNHKVL